MQRFARVLAIMLGLAAVACSKTTPPAAPSRPSTAAPAVAADPSLDARRSALDALIAEHWEYTLRRSPEFASVLGDRRYNDRWGDSSPEAIAADLAESRKFLARFEAIDTTGLPEQASLNKELKVRSLKERLDNARFESWLMPVNQFWGVHISLASLVPRLPFATVKDYDDYVARLGKLPTVLERSIGLMKQGVAKGLVPPKILLVQCVTQAQALASAAADASPFALPVKTFPAGVAPADQERLRAAVLAAVRDKVQPAYAAFARFLRDDYAPHGRTELGLWALPDGVARYNARIKELTTTDLTADQIHDIGLAEVARIEAEQLAIGRQLGYTDLAAFKDHIRKDRRLYASSAEDIVARYRAYTDQMYAKLPALFGRLPRQKVIVEPVEAFREKEFANAEYQQGTQDGSRPGVIRVNTYQPTKRATFDMESIAYHEGVPGHHMQIAIQQELGELPPFRQQSYYGAFQEGWGLYAERLGKEVGFYEDPYNDYGRLQAEMLRAIRLVVDTGIHAKRWSRDQVVAFFHDHSTIDEPSVQSETDRYIAIPGQALGYKIGQLTISRLRDKARAALGTAFDIRGFHDEVLGAGALPLDVLEHRIDAWIARHK